MRNVGATRYVMSHFKTVSVLRSESLKGAGAIGKYLLETYGRDSLAMIVDEGGTFYNRLDKSSNLPMNTRRIR